MSCWANTSAIKLMPRGHALNEAAYVVPVADGRETVELIEVQVAELKIKDAYIASCDAKLQQLDISILSLEEAVKNEREEWKRSVQKLEKDVKSLKSPLGIGLFGGYDPFKREAVVGIGLVYQILRF